MTATVQEQMNLSNQNALEQDEKTEKLVLIDGNSLVNRAYYALPVMTNSAGEPVQAVYGFATMFIKVLEEIRPDYVAVAFDVHAPTFRHKAYDGYKATRTGMPDQLAVQMPILKAMLGEMGVQMLECPGFEADDIIGTMAKRYTVQTYIITGDRDSLQLIDDSTQVWLTKRGITEVQKLDEAGLKAAFSLTPTQIIEYKALAGDSSDNIPGVAGVGDKTALSLLAKFESVDNLYAHLQDVTPISLRARLENGREMAFLSRSLATIDTKMDLPCLLEDCAYTFPFKPPVRLFFEQMGFKSLVRREDLFALEPNAPLLKSIKPTCNVRVLRDFESLSELLARCPGVMAFSLGESVNFAYSPDEEYIINLAYSFVDDGLDFIRVMEAFKPLLSDEKITKIVFDAKYLMGQLDKTFHIPLRGYFDVKLAQYLCDMTVEYATFSGLLKTYGLDEGEAATGLIFLRHTLDETLVSLKMHRLYYDIELPLVNILYGMEQEGFCIDLKKVDELDKKLSGQIEALTQNIHTMAGKEFNIKSPRQLGNVLFEDMGIPYPKKAASVRGYSTGAEILEQVETDNPIVGEALKYRFVTKLHSTYIEGLKKLVDSRGIVHTEFRQMLTTTGRLSSAEPNLQNIPVREEEGKALRAIFVAREGRTLVSADYSQIELRLMAHMSQDPIMIAAYRNGEDIHASTAAEVFGVLKSEVTPAMRREAKAVNFGILYGISEYGLATNLKISRQKAKMYIERYFERFRGVKEYLDRSVVEAKKTGTVSTLLGRIRKIPELFSSSYTTRQFGERAAMNMPLQGTAADIIKIAMINVSRALKDMKSKLILQIHDELIVDATLDEAEAVGKLLRDKMSGAISLNVPLTVDVGFGKSWLECK